MKWNSNGKKSTNSHFRFNQQQVQPVVHKLNHMEVVHVTIENIVVIDGEEVQIETLPNREELVYRLNKEALERINYYEEKTA